MARTFLFYFLTFVAFSASAAPETSVKPDSIQLTTPHSKVPIVPEIDNLQISQAPAKNSDHWLWRKSPYTANLGIGVGTGVFNKDKKQVNLGTFHFQMAKTSLDETTDEFALGLTSNGLFSLDWGHKQFSSVPELLGTWQPFYKYGIFGSYDPKDGLANLIDYERYFIQLSTGFESLGNSRRSWHLEIGGRLGLMGTQVYLQIYYALPGSI